MDRIAVPNPAALGGEVAFARPGVPRSLPLAMGLEHHAHHGGQAAVYLRLAGVTPPSRRLF